MLDVTIGLIIIALVGVILAMAVGRQQRGLQRLAESREATRLAESVLAQLQTGGPMPPAEARQAVSVQVSGEQAPAGKVWAEVSVDVNGRRASLWGPVPASAAHRADLPKVEGGGR